MVEVDVKVKERKSMEKLADLKMDRRRLYWVRRRGARGLGQVEEEEVEEVIHHEVAVHALRAAVQVTLHYLLAHYIAVHQVEEADGARAADGGAVGSEGGGRGRGRSRRKVSLTCGAAEAGVRWWRQRGRRRVAGVWTDWWKIRKVVGRTALEARGGRDGEMEAERSRAFNVDAAMMTEASHATRSSPRATS